MAGIGKPPPHHRRTAHDVLPVHIRLNRSAFNAGARLVTLPPSNPIHHILNGAAESLNGTIAEQMRALLLASGLPKSFWGLGVMYVVWLRNRTPMKKTAPRSLYEVMTGERPDLSRARKFGCAESRRIFSHMFPDSSLPMFRLPTSSPTRPDKCSLSTRTPTKRQILEEDSILSSPSTTRIAITSHESPGISLPMKRHFRLPTDSATTPPGIRTFAIADVSIVTASESTPPTSASQRRSTDFSCIQSPRQPQSIHYPGFDVFVDAARTVCLNALMNEAFDDQTTDILAAGSHQDEEKENIG
ncbi:hypothetical protein B0H14DRAFT_3740689 [Mycena olivaceomarginata]|nr:hypothetical protein B0H14DRAFT_3740689 [Mycena olivaceomarginata]